MKDIIYDMIIRDMNRNFVRYYVVSLLNSPDISIKEFEKRFKYLVDNCPDDDLDFHYKWSIENEIYELSGYIVEVAKKRGVALKS